MNRTLVTAGLLGATAVALGAYAAHGLGGALEASGYTGDGLAHRVENFQTGARYQLAAAAALLALALSPSGRWLAYAAAAIAGGAVLFSGLLYALAFAGDGWRWLGAIVPLGGLAMIAGWGLIAITGFFGTETGAEDSDKQELIRLEELLSHQQRLLQDLDSALTEQGAELDRHRLQLARSETALKGLLESQRAAEQMPDERPPHY